MPQSLKSAHQPMPSTPPALKKHKSGPRLTCGENDAPTIVAYVTEVKAHRGDDGLIGLVILDCAPYTFSVVVGIDSHSRAGRDGGFQLGDRVLEVDGRSVRGGQEKMRAALRASERPSLTFKVLRAFEAVPAPLSPTGPTGSPVGKVGSAAAASFGLPPPPTTPEARLAGGLGFSPRLTDAPATPEPSFKLNLARLRGDDAAKRGDAAPPAKLASGAPLNVLFKPGTPRNVLFHHATVITERHQKLARANRASMVVPSHEAAAAATAHLGNSPRHLTPRQEGRSLEDLGLGV